MLKIGFFIPFFVPAWRFGGPVRGTYELGKRLAKRGHKINIYTTDLSNNPGKRINDREKMIDGMDVYYFRNISNRLASKYKIIYPIKMKKFLLNEINKLDIIHLHDIYTVMTYWLYKTMKESKKPFLISTRGTLSTISQNSFGPVKKILNPLLIMKVLKKADIIFAQNELEKINLQFYGLKNIIVLLNGIDISEFQKLPSKTIFRKKYGFSDDDIIILYLGRLNQIKGLNYLIQAFSMLIKYPKLKLILIGPDDNYKEHLLFLINKYKLNNKVKIIDGLFGDKKLEAFSSSDIFCLPSLYDCCPNSMLEALAAGLPVITTQSNNLSFLVGDSFGKVIKPSNPREIKNAIISVVENYDKIHQNVWLERSNILRNFNWEKIVDLLEIVYENSIK